MKRRMSRRNGRRDLPASHKETTDGDSGDATATKCESRKPMAPRGKGCSAVVARDSRLVWRFGLRTLFERDTQATSARHMFDSKRLLRRATRSALFSS